MSNVTRQKKAKSLQGERWKKIETPRPTLKMDYYVSNLGRLKSKSKLDGSEHILNPTPDKKDYLKSSIKLEGGSYGLYVHMAVAKYWSKKPKKDGYNRYIHKDLNRLNNKASNIEWVTDDEWREYVRKRAKKYGYKPHRKGGKPKLSEKEVVRIKKHLAAGRMPKSKIAAKFGVSHTQINRIEAGENWAQLEVPGLEKKEAKPAVKRGRKAAPKKTTAKAKAAPKKTSTRATKAKTAAKAKPAAKKTSTRTKKAATTTRSKTTAKKAAPKKTSTRATKAKTAAKAKPAAKKTSTRTKKAAATSTGKTTAKKAASSTRAKKAAGSTAAKKTSTTRAKKSTTAAKTKTAKAGTKKAAAKKPAAKKPAAKKATTRGRKKKS